MAQIEKLIRLLQDLKHVSFTAQRELSGTGMMIGVGTCVALLVAVWVFLPHGSRS